MTTELTQCMICLENITETSESFTLSCNHIFHTKCIMDWFRSRSSSGNCPLCNDNPSSDNVSIFYGSKIYYEERFKQVKKYINKNKTKYPNLKEDLIKIKEIEKSTKEKLKIKNNFLKKHKEIRNKMREQQADYWKSVRKENKEKMKIISKCPLLIL